MAKYLGCSKRHHLETGLAQLVEHWSPKPGVGSSSLSTRAKFENEYSFLY